jgi:hypothetical protein
MIFLDIDIYYHETPSTSHTSPSILNTTTMSEESNDPNAIDLLSRLATLLEEVANNLNHNRLDRTAIQTLLHQYSSRAESDGHLINASKQDSQCVEHGVFLSYVHVELLSWLTRHNYTIPATSVKWYSWRKLLSQKYRLPSLFSARAHAAQLEELLRNVVAKADLLHAELRAREVCDVSCGGALLIVAA